MQYDSQGMETQVLDRPLHNHLAFFDRKTCLGDRLGNVSRRNGAVELPTLTGLANDNDAQPLELAADLRRFRLAMKIISFELRTLALEIGEILLRRAQSL